MSALSGIDIALWDLKGIVPQPVTYPSSFDTSQS